MSCAFAPNDLLIDDFFFLLIFGAFGFLAFRCFLAGAAVEGCPAAAAAAFLAFEAAVPFIDACLLASFFWSSSAVVGPSGRLFWRALSTLGRSEKRKKKDIC